MDSGAEIPGLGESWTFAGAKAMEWVAGLVAFMVVSELFKINPAHSMPVLMLVWLGTTLGLASVRRRFPDEERGVRNAAMVALGFAPPGIPAPAKIQPYWSGIPVREMGKNSYWEQLDLGAVFDSLDADEAGATRRVERFVGENDQEKAAPKVKDQLGRVKGFKVEG